MSQILLINMPFAGLHLPSFALTQLQAVLKGELDVTVEIAYLNHDFAHYMGLELYQFVSTLARGLWVGEWFFRQAAFPAAADNAAAYLRRFYPRRDAQTEQFKQLICEKRQGVDAFLDELIERYALEQASIVGFTSMFLQNMACFALARKLKARRPEIVTVMGGANCEAPMGEALVKHAPQIDFVFSGPALMSFPQFVRHWQAGESKACQRIDGVLSKHNRVLWPGETPIGEGPQVGPMGQERDINAPLALDYESFLEAHERHFADGEVDKVLLFETSRGCWWGERSKCTFCGFNGANIHYRALSPERAIEQFAALFRYAPRCSYFWAVDNIMPRDYPQEVFAHLDTPPGAAIGYELRPNLDGRDIQMLAQAGVKSIQPGIESLDTPTLKRMRKGTTAFQNLRFLKHCVMHGLSLWWNFLIGFPGEDKNVAQEVYRKYLADIPALLHLPPPIEVYPIRFDRYSHYFCHPEQYALDLYPFDFYELTFPFDQEVLAELAYCFMDRRDFSAEYFTTAIRWIGKIRARIDEWWNRWHGEAASPPPLLFLKGQGASSVVYDSRSGEVIEHPVGDVGRQALACLERPGTVADLAAALGHLPGFDAAAQLAFLQGRRLVFQEGERYMSLVLPQEPPPLARLPQGQPSLSLLAAVYPNALFKRPRRTTMPFLE